MLDSILIFLPSPHWNELLVCSQKLISDMIQVDPHLRKTAEECLAAYQDVIFPSFFSYWHELIQRSFDNSSIILDYKVSM
jgi:hypothetical protein